MRGRTQERDPTPGKYSIRKSISRTLPGKFIEYVRRLEILSQVQYIISFWSES
jgi:hypothetical protein